LRKQTGKESVKVSGSKKVVPQPALLQPAKRTNKRYVFVRSTSLLKKYGASPAQMVQICYGEVHDMIGTPGTRGGRPDANKVSFAGVLVWPRMARVERWQN